MGSDEENLDELLKSIMSTEEETDSLELDHEDIGAEAVPSDFDLGDFAEDDLAANDFEIGNFAADDFSVSDFDLGDFAADDFSADNFAIEDFGVEEPGESAVLEEAEASVVPMEEMNAPIEEKQTADDLEALFAAADAVESGEAVPVESEAVNEHMDPEDMLALLEGMSEDTTETKVGISSGEGKAKEEKLKSKKKKKGGFSGFFSSKKNKEEEVDLKTDSGAEQSVSETADWADGNDWETGGETFIPTEENLESLFDAAAAAAKEEESIVTDEDETAGKGKKGGFFSKVFAFLTETDDDESEEGMTEAHGMEPSDENKNILEELEKEDKKKKKKKVKGKKGQAEEFSEDEDEDGDRSVKDKKKEKKKKRRDKRVKEESPEQIIRESVAVKKVSKKNIAIIAGLCLTITVVIVVLCSIVPGFFDKRKAREAYYQSDYSRSYELLYGKQLDNSDTIIFHKSKIILELDRKLKSYHNYIGIGKEVQALDALIAGVEKYPDILLRAEEYHVEAEVNAIYETILNILSDKYDISEAAAKVIIDYDDLTYTRKLESVVNGTPFEFAQERETTVSDVLPEEEAVIQREEPVTTENTEGEETTAVSEEIADELPVESETEENLETTLEEALPAEDTAGDETSAEDVVLEEEVAEDVSGATEDSNNIVPEENRTAGESASGSQGEMIQGIKQPIAVEIYGD